MDAMLPPNLGQSPRVLDSNDLAGVIDYMQSPLCRRVFVLTGAGLSTSAGIPDFRSPGTGLYDNLQKLQLPYPEAVFDISFFQTNPIPFYTLARDLAPGRFRPTPAHCFVRLLHEKGLLHTCFTQNIDTLERKTGVPASKLVEAHGSFASQRCIICRTPFDDEKMRVAIKTAKVPYCDQRRCGGLVKPDIVFFGEGLPDEFGAKAPSLATADLLFILGTSLKVYPFAALPSLVPPTCPRVLINMEAVGDIGSRPEDVLLLGECDKVVREIAEEMDWTDELEKLWEETAIPPEEQEEETSETRPVWVATPEKKSSGIEVFRGMLSGILGSRKLAERKPDVKDELSDSSALASETEEALQIGSSKSRIEAEIEQIAKDVEKGLKISEEAGDSNSGEDKKPEADDKPKVGNASEPVAAPTAVEDGEGPQEDDDAVTAGPVRYLQPRFTV